MARLRNLMAMTSLTTKGLLSAVVGIFLFVALVWFGGFEQVDLSKINLGYAIGAVVTYVVMLCLRAINFRLIAGKNGKQNNFRNWCRLAGMHQLIFIVAPSGTGDLTFPALAKKIVGVDVSNSIGTIVLSRIRDVFTIVGLGSLGLAGSGLQPLLTVPLAAISFVSLIWTELAIQSLVNVIALIAPKRAGSKGWLEKLAETTKVHSDHRFLRNALSLAIWLCAGVGVWFGFSAAGYRLSMLECWVVILFLNVAGALAVSIAGIGFAEAGAAGALILLGEAGPEAAAIAVVARPTMLIALTIAALFLERAHQFPQLARPPRSS